READAPRAGVERREELVLGEHLGVGQRVQERALAGVGVADDRHDRHAASGPARPPLLALLAELAQLRLEPRHPLARPALADLELRLAGPAPADAAREARERVVLLPEPRQEVLHLGELHLELSVPALRALREDV